MRTFIPDISDDKNEKLILKRMIHARLDLDKGEHQKRILLDAHEYWIREIIVLQIQII